MPDKYHHIRLLKAFSKNMQHSGRMGIPALDWGLEKEPCVCEEYRQMMKMTHVKFKVEQPGLFVHVFTHIWELR